MPLAKGLLAVQIGLSMVLLIGAGLFARSLRNLGTADLGLARENLLLMDVRPAARPRRPGNILDGLDRARIGFAGGAQHGAGREMPSSGMAAGTRRCGSSAPASPRRMRMCPITWSVPDSLPPPAFPSLRAANSGSRTAKIRR